MKQGIFALAAALAVSLVAVSARASASMQEPAQAPAPDLPGAAELRALRVEAAPAAVARLEELASWCQSQRLYRGRDRAWSAILWFEPDHAAARRGLRYFRVRGTEWRQSPSYREGRDKNPEALTEFQQRFATALDPVRVATFEHVARGRAELGPEGVERILLELLELDVDDATVHRLLGEQPRDGVWILNESAVALARRAAIPEYARTSIAAAPEPELYEPLREDLDLGPSWRSARRTKRVRVLGTMEGDEVAHTARVSHALGDYFRVVFQRAQAHRPDLRIYLLDDPQQKQRMIAQHPDLDEQLRAGLLTAAGGWLGRGNRLAEWSPDPKRRLDGAARQTLGTLLMDAYGIDARQGWAWEGIGLYLVHRMLGTRMTWFFETSAYAPQTTSGLWQRLQDPTVDWMEEGRALLASDDSPRLVFLIGRQLNSMREQDLLYSYVLAAYLLEGRPQEAPELLERLGAGEQPAVAFEEVLGATIPQLEKRLLRWLEETR